MLKIKDNVDLKELEKFGFEKYIMNDKLQNYKAIIDVYSQTIPHINTQLLVNVALPTLKPREIHIFDYFGNHHDISNLDIIYDLIKADLVEKSD